MKTRLCTESGESEVTPAGDAEWRVEGLRRRDPDSFDRMIAAEGPAIQRLVSRLLGWRDDCDDVVQEVFIAAWEQIDRFRGEASVSSWLYAIAFNQCRKHRRQRARWRQTFQRLCERNRDRLEAPRPPSDNPDLEHVYQALRALPHRDRELIVLCGLEEKTVEEVAALTGLRKNTLEVRLHRARKKLKQLLPQNHD